MRLRFPLHSLLALGLLTGQGLGRPLAAQGNGVLLGVEHAGQYRTFWITMSGDHAEVAAELADLVVPRREGFWHVGVATLCDEAGTRQVVWQTRLGRAPAIAGTVCSESAPPQPTDARGSAAASNELRGCHDVQASVQGVLPDWVSERYTFGQTEGCEPRGGRRRDSSAVRKFDARTAVGLRELFGARADRAYAEAVLRGYIEVSENVECPEPVAEKYDLASWMIVHRRGTWRAVAAYDENTGDCALSAPMNLSLPAVVTGRSSPAVALDSTEFRDWAVSPDGRHVVALAKAGRDEVRLQVRAVKGRRPGPALLSHDIGPQSRIVVAEWATGKYVAEWTRAMRSTPRRQ